MVMGYIRPITEFNIGKRSEYETRKYFKEDKATSRMETMEDFEEQEQQEQ